MRGNLTIRAILLTVLPCLLGAATINNITGSGNYNTTSIWGLGHSGTTNELVQIGIAPAGSFNLNLNANAGIVGMTIASGSVLTNSSGSAHTLTVGSNTSGGLTLNGGTLSASSGNLTIANHSGTGLGLTNISSGTFSNGTLQSGGSTALIALPTSESISTIASTGSVILGGAGAKINTGSSNALANLSTLQGGLSLQNGATLTTGSDLATSGTLQVTGTNSKLTVNSGFGALTQTGGATTLTNRGTLAGNVVLNGGSFTAARATVTGDFTNSAGGTGNGLFVTDNSSAANSTLTVNGNFIQSGGNLTFAASTSPNESTIVANDFLFEGGQGTVKGIGRLQQGVGTTEVTASTNLYVDSNDYVDYVETANSYFQIDAGQTLTVHNYSQTANGQVTVNGTLHALGSINLTTAYQLLGNGTYDSPQTTLGQQIGLIGSPTFTGNLTADGQFSTDAWWNPGDPVKTITIGGNFLMGSVDPFNADINMEVAGINSYDRFVINGSATIDGGGLAVDMCKFSAPGSFTTWDIFHANGGITGTFASEGATFGCTMPSGFSFVQTSHDIFLEYTPETPEPESWLLLTSGAALILLARAKSKR